MAWTQTANIRGASGASGASGAQGPTGASGATGGTGAPGASGPPGTTTWSGITDKPAVIAAGVDGAAARNVISAEYTGNKGQPSGYAALDASGLVPSSQLPSFVDDVVEAANLAAFPATGESGKIYTALDTGKVYRWGGSSYTEISPSPGSTDAVPEGSTNLYYTAARADGRITAAVGSTVQAYSATLTTYASKSAPTGAVVGTTDTQTLTNKDLSGTSNTFPAFIKRSVSTVTSNSTLGSAANTDYTAFVNIENAGGSSVVALLNGNGTNNSTTITDGSPLASNWTTFGNAKLSTAQKKFGTASISFSGTSGDYIQASAAASNYAFGTGDFCIEMQIYATTITGLRGLYEGRPNSFSGSWPSMFCDGGKIVYLVNGSIRITGSTTINTGTWYHVALCRSGTTTRLFVNGTVDGTWSDSTNYVSSTAGYPIMGGMADGGSAKGSFGNFDGYFDDIGISKTARYVANFTAPTQELVFMTGGTVTLPTAVSSSGLYTVKNISNYVQTIATTSSQTIDGSTTLALASGSAAVRLLSDGSNWRTV